MHKEKAVAERLRGNDVRLIDRISARLRTRSLRYYEGHGHGTKQPSDDYDDVAIALIQKARELSSRPSPHGNHSLKTWLAILLGPDMEKEILGEDSTFGNKT